MEPYAQQDTLDLRDYFAVLRRQTWLIVHLGLDRTPQKLLESIDVDVVTDTHVLDITATDEDPELAAAIAASKLGQVTAELSTFESRDTLVRGGGEVIRPAEVPESPASPKPLRTGILALVLGLMLGVGLAFLLRLPR